CRAVLQNRCVLENYSIRYPLSKDPYPAMYDAMHALGPTIDFQTAAPERIGDWEQCLQWAIAQGASSIELNRGYPRYDKDTLRAFAVQLAQRSPEEHDQPVHPHGRGRRARRGPDGVHRDPVRPRRGYAGERT